MSTVRKLPPPDCSLVTVVMSDGIAFRRFRRGVIKSVILNP